MSRASSLKQGGPPPLWQHQAEALRKSCLGPHALFMDRGTGKTRVVVETVKYLYKTGALGRALIICPRRCYQVWANEFKHWADYPSHVLHSKGRRYLAAWKPIVEQHGIETYPTVVIINYEAVLTEAVWSMLKQLEWDLVAFDESTRIKSARAKRTKRLLGFVEHIPYRYILSGLPVTNSPLDLYTQMRVVRHDIWGLQSEWGFKHRYAIMGGYLGKQIAGWRNLDEMSTAIQPYSFRVRKEECLDLPPVVIEEIMIEMGEEQATWYADMKRRFLVEFTKAEGKLSAVNVGAQRVRLHQIAGGFLPGATGEIVACDPNPKMEAAVESIEQLVLAARQVVVWCAFRAEIKELAERLLKKEIPVSVLWGGMSDSDGDRAVMRFQSGESQVFIGQPKSGGLGISLSNSSYVLYYSNTDSVEDRVQSFDRSYRPGQKGPSVTRIDLISQKTVDVSILHMLEKHMRIGDVIVDRRSAEDFVNGRY